ncbi:RagB/SusD family nutrient uptake outer membrane protein [Reichenbachiella sp. MSK19-1]|uniref:RagB/SusD family nutrient uptake outer membrane protein n=1 Tax=Reichenbachiella sp. MSK19-1 TaxID=1897631 RepID=UPI000EC2F63C|nr:RagB/SusD family nutrient uptake outer membrane protein [Reichenbachiella sp. MSK19-1]RJE71875.1 hypothetical protein BGP76_07250 [Reichenbachiella sp. MSK19-1]
MNSTYKTGFNWKVIVVSFIPFLGLSACNDDFLDTVPQTAIEESEAFSTEGKILAQVNNLYRQLQNPTLYGGRYIVFNEQRADEFGQNDGNAAAGSAVWNQSVASTNDFANNVWSAAYTAINSANILLSALEDTDVITEETSTFYRAEAKYVRALSYLCLVQTYARPYTYDPDGLGVPLRLSPIRTSGHNNLARSTVAEVYDQILQDLDEAETELPESYPTALLNTSRAHKATAIALKSRVYLLQGDYPNVVSESSKLVPSTMPYQYVTSTITHELETDIATVFGGSYTGPEAIFSIPFINSTTETPPTQSSLAFNYLGQPIIFMAAAGIASDPALNSPEDSRSLLVTTNANNQKVLTKFSITVAPFRDYVPVIRYAEIMLNYAEAAANTGDLTLGAQLLQAVRNRANPSHVFADAAVNTTDALLNTIWNERRIELVGEGHRLGDLQRRGLTLPAKVGAIGTAPAVNPGASNYIWPIPSGESATNNLIVENP